MSTATLPVLLVLLAVGYGAKHKPVFSEEIKEIIQHVHNACVGKTGVAEEDIANCENGIFKDDMKLKCYMFCLLEEASLVDDDNNVDYDMLVSLIPEEYSERATKMIFGCRHLDTNDKDKCQRAFDVHKCSYGKDPDCSAASVATVATMGESEGALIPHSARAATQWYKTQNLFSS